MLAVIIISVFFPRLGDNNVLKLCDSALSRDLFPSDYHCLGDNENRPIKWMPMEAIGQKKHSRASDVVRRKEAVSSVFLLNTILFSVVFWSFPLGADDQSPAAILRH